MYESCEIIYETSCNQKQDPNMTDYDKRTGQYTVKKILLV